MQECNSPRNSWRKLIKTMRLWGVSLNWPRPGS